MATEAERHHLLAPEERPSSSDGRASDTLIARKLPSKHAWSKHLRFYVLIFSLQFVTNLGFYLADLPVIRLFERKICQVHYGSTDDIAEENCKVPDIQNRLAFIFELRNAFNAMPGRISNCMVVYVLTPSLGLLLSLWYGGLVDRYGRKPIIAWNYVGETLSLAWVLLICEYLRQVPADLVVADLSDFSQVLPPFQHHQRLYGLQRDFTSSEVDTTCCCHTTILCSQIWRTRCTGKAFWFHLLLYYARRNSGRDVPVTPFASIY